MGKKNLQNKTEQGQQDILVTFARLFKKHNIPYLLTGSLGVAFYGYPRATHDIDFVLEISSDAKEKIMRALVTLPRVYLQDTTHFHDRDISFYTLYHTYVGVKIDLWLVTDTEFEKKWQRRGGTRIMGITIPLVSSEDLMLTKLVWCKEVPSERHMRDCVGIWKVQKGKLDENYLFAQAKKLKIDHLLTEVANTKEY